MMKLSYYPGCALQSMSWDYRESIKLVTEALDIHLEEIRDWTCCGASAAHSMNDRMSQVLPVGNLRKAAEIGQDVAVACPMCFKRLNHSRQLLQQKKLDVPWSFDSDIEIVDLARVLASDTMLERIRSKVQRPLKDLRVVCYYGCQVVRPPHITGYRNYDNPQHMDQIVEALGATPIDWSFKTSCCGAGVGVPKKELGLSLAAKLIGWAKASGAQAIVACCPLCQTNLDMYQPELCEENGLDSKEAGLPVLYYTELLALAFGLESVRPGLQSHLVDPLPLVSRLLDHCGRNSSCQM
jgi:heterodisulfide reductase subunit B2